MIGTPTIIGADGEIIDIKDIIRIVPKAYHNGRLENWSESGSAKYCRDEKQIWIYLSSAPFQLTIHRCTNDKMFIHILNMVKNAVTQKTDLHIPKAIKLFSISKDEKPVEKIATTLEPSVMERFRAICAEDKVLLSARLREIIKEYIANEEYERFYDRI